MSIEYTDTRIVRPERNAMRLLGYGECLRIEDGEILRRLGDGSYEYLGQAPAAVMRRLDKGQGYVCRSMASGGAAIRLYYTDQPHVLRRLLTDMDESEMYAQGIGDERDEERWSTIDDRISRNCARLGVSESEVMR